MCWPVLVETGQKQCNTHFNASVMVKGTKKEMFNIWFFRSTELRQAGQACRCCPVLGCEPSLVLFGRSPHPPPLSFPLLFFWTQSSSSATELPSTPPLTSWFLPHGTELRQAGQPRSHRPGDRRHRGPLAHGVRTDGGTGGVQGGHLSKGSGATGGDLACAGRHHR